MVFGETSIANLFFHFYLTDHMTIKSAKKAIYNINNHPNYIDNLAKMQKYQA